MNKIGCAAGLLNVRGFTLLEVLFVTLVFSVGVLGTVSLQAHAIRHADDARYRAKALQLASALIGRLWGEDLGTMAERYDSSGNGQGYRDFVIEANVLPGTSLAGNAPLIKVDAGPSQASRAIAITLRWQKPGEATAHRYDVSATIGRN